HDQLPICTTSKSVTVAAPNQPPTAAFTASFTALTCSFTSSSSDPDGSISAYSWTFGDGATATSQNPSRTYAAGGTYTVTLTVTDNQGATASTSKGVTVTAPNQPPTAAFTSSCSGLTCSFTSTSTDSSEELDQCLQLDLRRRRNLDRAEPGPHVRGRGDLHRDPQGDRQSGRDGHHLARRDGHPAEPAADGRVHLELQRAHLQLHQHKYR